MSQPRVAESVILDVKGLVLNPSTFDPKAADGSLTVANNVVIDRPSVVATRRGFNNEFAKLINDGALSLYQYNNTKLINTSDHDLHVDKLNNGVLSTYTGSYPQPDPSNPESRVRGLETNKNFYFITQQGTYRLDHIDGEPRLAGAPPGLNGYGSVFGTTGFLPNNTQIAYRVVFGYKDYNQQLVLGAPSSRIIIANSGTGMLQNVNVTFQVPKEIQAAPTEFFFQVYRGHASPDLSTEPDDEMALTYEDICSAGATIIIPDITPDTLLGAALYTNQGQDGILQSNYRAPWALDVCTYKQYAFYANTRTLMNADITLISAGAANGADALTLGDTVTFTPAEVGTLPFTLLGATSNNTALGWFAISNTGNPALDIQITASNLCLVANAYAANTFLTAYYTSGSGDLPGKMNFARLTLVPDAFTISSTHTQSFEQAMPITSINDSRPNRIYYSKFNQPEAVPIVNYLEFGSANQPIRRIVPLRDGVMILKDDGVFRVSGNNPASFNITPIDYNVRILAANTAAELDNKVYFLSDQGIVALSDSDAQIMSIVIDKTIIENTSPDLFPNLRDVAWGIAYQSDRKYILFMPTVGSDVQATQQYVYNHIFQLWTRWTLSATCGLIFKRDGKMYLGSHQGTADVSGDSFVYQERKTFTSSDYADNQYTTSTTTSGVHNTIVIANPVLPPGVLVLPGWSILQTSTGSQARIMAVTTGASYTTLVLDNAPTWAAGTVVLYTPVYSEVQTIQLDCNNPAMNKQFSEMVYMFTVQDFASLTATISSNTAGIPIVDILIPTQRGGWGIDPWGTSAWGGGTLGQGKIRRYVPAAIQRAGWIYLNITHAECFTSFGWSGVELFYKPTSTRQF